MDYFIGSIIPWSVDYAPHGWLLCDGRTIPINQYTALFSLLGSKYGGDGKTNFALPNLCGRVAPGANTPIDNGKIGGFERAPLTPNQIANHNHNLNGNVSGSTTGKSYPDTTSGLGISQAGPRVVNMYNRYDASSANMVNLTPGTILPNGGDAAHNNVQPYLALNYIICTMGIYPSRP